MAHFAHVVFYQKLATCVVALLYLNTVCIPKHYIYTSQTSDKPLFYVKLMIFFN